MNIYQSIQDFVTLAIKNGAAESMDEIYLRNQLLHFIGENDWQDPVKKENTPNSLSLMDQLMLAAEKNGVIPEDGREFYEAALMDFITPLPSHVNRDFWRYYEESPEQATNYFYSLAKEINQVKSREIARNIAWSYVSKYGELEMTINLSKPEKDPRAIAAAKLLKSSSYPACQLCMENEGFYGRLGKPARSNHRIIRLDLNGQTYGFQYSPYAYYREHSIILNEKHQAMKINRQTFENLLTFLQMFPHYMIGSNADLPIVGGSILNHDHYQAGYHEFSMTKASLREAVKFADFPGVSAGIVEWPLTVLRLCSKSVDDLVELSLRILESWQKFSDEELDIIATGDDGVQHHTITPIARKRADNFEMDLVLRDNNTSEQYPDGIFHPHKDKHHIKKENIGLIEVMGLAILPPRLKDELVEVEKFLLNKKHNIAESHLPWAKELKANDNFNADNVHAKVLAAVGQVFETVLEDAGVFKNDTLGQAGLKRFIETI